MFVVKLQWKCSKINANCTSNAIGVVSAVADSHDAVEVRTWDTVKSFNYFGCGNICSVHLLNFQSLGHRTRFSWPSMHCIHICLDNFLCKCICILLFNWHLWTNRSKFLNIEVEIFCKYQMFRFLCLISRGVLKYGVNPPVLYTLGL